MVWDVFKLLGRIAAAHFTSHHAAGNMDGGLAGAIVGRKQTQKPTRGARRETLSASEESLPVKMPMKINFPKLMVVPRLRCLSIAMILELNTFCAVHKLIK